jgi:hypothetical protein
MKTFGIVVLLLVALVTLSVSARPATAFGRPELTLGAGRTLGADSHPGDGGMTFSLAPMWPVTDRTRFGFTMFADDIGSTLGRMTDPNDGIDLGSVALRHRWTWGAAWRGDWDFARARTWAASMDATWGWSRVEDDVRGTVVQAASAVGTGVGLDIRRPVTKRYQLGLAIDYRLLTGDKNTDYQRTRRYATAAVTWRWLRESAR